MAFRCRSFKSLALPHWWCTGRLLRSPQLLHSRTFTATSSPSTDGVFRELTASRVQIPWIEAFRKKQAESDDATEQSETPASPVSRKLEPKHMSDSHHSVVIPLGQDPWLLDTYANASGHIRLGTIFMDLDALSGVIAYKHTGPGVTTVTAAFDRIAITHPLTEICDLELSGQVTYATGRSSMEISLQVAKAPKPGEKVRKEDVFIECSCTMVSLDPKTKKPVNINPVIVETEEERQLFRKGERNSKQRKERSKSYLVKHTPNDEESDLIHAIWQKELQYHDPNDPLRRPQNVILMEKTQVTTAVICSPQHRNLHQWMIFGGFLLKQTFELAFLCAAAFAHTRPTFVSLDPSTFENPVPVGSVLYLTATVADTDPPLVSCPSDGPSDVSKSTRVHVRVRSKVRNVEHGETRPTGQFQYTFLVDRDIKVMPNTYSEFMIYLDARRRVQQVKASVQEHGQGDLQGQGERVTE